MGARQQSLARAFLCPVWHIFRYYHMDIYLYGFPPPYRWAYGPSPYSRNADIYYQGYFPIFFLIRQMHCPVLYMPDFSPAYPPTQAYPNI